MKTRYWVIILVIVSVVYTGVIFFVSDSFPHPFFWGGKHRMVNQYEVFRDLLAIVLTLAGLFIALLGAGVYRLIYGRLDAKAIECFASLDAKAKEHRASLDATVKKKIDEEVNYAISTLFLELSYDYWRAYEVGGKFQRDKTNELERAIEQSKKALARTERLDTKQKRFLGALCLAKNNLAYHLAARNWTKDTEKAISLAKYGYDRVGDFDFEMTSYWMETYGFVLIRMGTEEQQTEGRTIIKDLRDRRYLPKILRDSIEGKYTKELTLRRAWD